MDGVDDETDPLAAGRRNVVQDPRHDGAQPEQSDGGNEDEAYTDTTRTGTQADTSRAGHSRFGGEDGGAAGQTALPPPSARRRDDRPSTAAIASSTSSRDRSAG